MHDSFLKIFWALNFFVCEVECLYLSDTLAYRLAFWTLSKKNNQLETRSTLRVLVFGTNNDCHFMAPYFTKNGDKNLLMFHKAIFVLHCMVHFLNAPNFVHVDSWCCDWGALNNQKVLNQSKKLEHSWGQHFYCFQKLTLSTRFFWHFAAFFWSKFQCHSGFFELFTTLQLFPPNGVLMILSKEQRFFPSFLQFIRTSVYLLWAILWNFWALIYAPT